MVYIEHNFAAFDNPQCPNEEMSVHDGSYETHVKDTTIVHDIDRNVRHLYITFQCTFCMAVIIVKVTD